jgi:type I restriction enzyme S subunit
MIGTIGNPIIVDIEPNFAIKNVSLIKFKDSDIFNRYILYLLKSNSFIRYIEDKNRGGTQKFISLKDIREYSFVLPQRDKQNKIVSTLDEIQSIITHRKQQLEKLDELVKARFVEMFGEVGTDPKGFGMKQLNDVCEINPKKTDDKRLRSGLEVSFVPMPAVSETGDIDATEIRTYDEVKTGFTYFAEKDVLFAKITPCMENGKGAVAEGLCNEIGFGSTEFHVLRPIQEVSNPYWLYAITSFEMFRREAARKMTGSAGQRRVPARFLEQYRVAVPPIDLQNKFAAFVSQTDKSKVAVQKALDEAQLLFDSLMQEYFG